MTKLLNEHINRYIRLIWISSQRMIQSDYLTKYMPMNSRVHLLSVAANPIVFTHLMDNIIFNRNDNNINCAYGKLITYKRCVFPWQSRHMVSHDTTWQAVAWHCIIEYPYWKHIHRVSFIQRVEMFYVFHTDVFSRVSTCGMHIEQGATFHKTY